MEIGSWKYSGEAILLLVQTISKLFGGISVCLGSWWNKLNNKYRVEIVLFL